MKTHIFVERLFYVMVIAFTLFREKLLTWEYCVMPTLVQFFFLRFFLLESILMYRNVILVYVIICHSLDTQS